MIEHKIYEVSALNGWKMTEDAEYEITYVNFQRLTVSGVPFTLTVEMRDNSAEWLVNEILSFVEAFVPEDSAVEYMEQTKARSLYKYRLALADMQDIRLMVWLLACAISLSSEVSGIVPVSLWKGDID